MAATKMQGRGPSTGGMELYSPTYFGACALGGVISCGPTHAGEYLDLCVLCVLPFPRLFFLPADTPIAVTPLDLVSHTFGA